MSSDGVNSGRRRFLTAATSVVGVAGAVGIAVPFVGSWNPSAKAKAAGAMTYIDDKHLGVDVLVSRLDPAAARIARVFRQQQVIAFALAVMGVGGTRIVMDRFDSGQLLPALQLSRGWFYLAIPVSGWLIALFALGNLVSIATSRKDNPPGDPS